MMYQKRIKRDEKAAQRGGFKIPKRRKRRGKEMEGNDKKRLVSTETKQEGCGIIEKKSGRGTEK